MKYVIASDLHGSALYTERLLESVEREEADRLLLLGDLLYHGPRNDLPTGYDPKETATLLNKKKNMIFAVRGNCEAEVDQQVLEFPVMADYAVFIEGTVKVFATHGHLYNENHIPPLTEDFIFFAWAYAYPSVRTTWRSYIYESRVRIHSQGRQRAILYTLE